MNNIENTLDERDRTREMDCPRTQVSGGMVEWVEGSKDYYRFTQTQKTVRDELADWWDRLDPDADDGAPVTPEEKRTRPHERNYLTKEQIEEASSRLFKK